MTESVQTLNLFLGFGTILLQAGTVLLIIALIFKKQSSFLNDSVGFFAKNGVLISFLLMLFSTAMAFYYSDVLGFVPCWLCWMQRIFIFAQVPLLGVAVWKGDAKVADYSIALSVVGAVLAFYQHYLQTGGEGIFPCPAVGGDCAKRIMFEFGYVTYPLMAASLLVFTIVLMLAVKAVNKGKAI